MTKLPTSAQALADLCREILPPFADVTVEPDRAVVVKANGDNRGLLLFWDEQGDSPGWAYRFGRESGAILDSEDLGWSLCDVLGVASPKRSQLEALAAEAGSHGDEDGRALAMRAIDGDSDAIVKCARWVAEVAAEAAAG